jgi:rsbT antagonist protein RsbS
MSHPNLRKLGSMLLVTIPDFLTDSEVATVKRETIASVRRFSSRSVVLDFSAVEICDSYFGRFVHSLSESTRLLGAKIVVCGLSDAVVETLVEMGFSLPNVQTVLDLDAAIVAIEPQGGGLKQAGGARPTDIPDGDSSDEPEDDRVA